MLTQSLPFALTEETALSAASALAAFLVVIAVWFTLIERSPMRRRLQRLERQRNALKAGWRAPRRNQFRIQSTRTAMRALVQRLNLLKDQTAGTVAGQLARAGWRSRDAVITFLFLKLCLPLVFGIGAYVAVNVLQLITLPGPGATLAPLAAAAFGAYGPGLFVRNAISKREKAIQKGLPDALDLLVICAEAGLSLDAALTRVAGEMERSCPPVAEEFGLAAVELGFLPERRKALDNLIRRVQTPSMRGIVNTLVQTEKYGTPLANALRVLSAEFRNERMLKAEEKAARLPATLTVPMIVFILPTLMVVLLGPAILRTIDALKDF